MSACVSRGAEGGAGDGDGADEGGVRDSALVGANDTVLIVENEGNHLARRSRVVDLSNKSKVTLGKSSCAARDLVGLPYGSFFVAKGAKLVHSPNANPELDNFDQDEAGEVAQDNSRLVDNNTSQQLSAEAIRKMREQGADGSHIVQALVENSQTFASKTEYSQKKYLKKKKAKFMGHLRVDRLSLFGVCQHYFEFKPQKVGHIRPDTLSRIMFCANPQPGGCILVAEQCLGLVTSALASAVDGNATIIHAYSEQNPRVDVLRLLGFSRRVYDAVHAVSLDALLAEAPNREQSSAAEASKEEGDGDKGAVEESQQQERGEKEAGAVGEGEGVVAAPQGEQGEGGEGRRPLVGDAEVAGKAEGEGEEGANRGEEGANRGEEGANRGEEGEAEAEEAMAQPAEEHDDDRAMSDDEGQGEDKQAQDNKPVPEPKDAAAPAKRKAPLPYRKADGKAAWESVRQANGVDTLVIAGELSPVRLFGELLPLLIPGGTFVVYCPAQQPLVECFEWARKTGLALGMALAESWCRDYQVLPARSHPLTSMSASSGFLLTGVRVDEAEQAPRSYSAPSRKTKRGSQGGRAPKRRR